MDLVDLNNLSIYQKSTYFPGRDNKYLRLWAKSSQLFISLSDLGTLCDHYRVDKIIPVWTGSGAAYMQMSAN